MTISRTCRSCGKTLYSSHEKEKGLCANCERLTNASKCLRCGSPLLSHEIALRLCTKCQRLDPKCSRCGVKLFSSAERQRGVCDRCARRN